MLIILAEHDIGFSLILFVVFLTMIWLATGRWTYVAIGLVAFTLATFLAAHLLGQVNGRIAIWLDPWKYYSSTGYYAGYQPVQGELAFGRGGLFGTGIGLGLAAGTVPIATSDFIFSVMGEELGLFGTVAMVVAFLLLIGSGLRIALTGPFGVRPARGRRPDGDARHPGLLHHGGRREAAAADGRHAAVRLVRRVLARGELRARSPSSCGCRTRAISRRRCRPPPGRGPLRPS